MARQEKILKFRQSAKFVVRWHRDGDLKVVDAPFLRGENPFILCAGKVAVNVLSAVDRVSEAFFAKAGPIYEAQFKRLSESAQREVRFPLVEFSVTVSGKVALSTKRITQGEGIAEAEIVGLDGKHRKIRVKKSISRESAHLHPAVGIARLGNSLDWEIEGHGDPNCRFTWGGCKCSGTCCTHIVRDLGGTCWNERCGWSWLFLHCGCVHNKQVRCPEFQDPNPPMLGW